MGYIWFVYFAAMALAFWFAMTLMYDGNEAARGLFHPLRLRISRPER